MYVYIYIYIYVHVCVCIHIYIYIHIHPAEVAPVHGHQLGVDGCAKPRSEQPGDKYTMLYNTITRYNMTYI